MPPPDDTPATRMYALVLACEVLVIVALWLLGRTFSA